ncbi:MAG: hypothetical protein E7L40_08885 [Corynebacterium kroppenstedtii]|nr:hypothetical protein [Corynebacterium kroppenstedtii]MDU7287666.1 hypothetical protein [Corynebacterium kroppenstedtii]
MARHSKETVTSPVSPGELAAQQSDHADTATTYTGQRRHCTICTIHG